MNTQQKKTYLAWLSDAHAMELALIDALGKQVKETGDMPDIQNRLKEHLEETKGHAKKVEAIVKRHGGDVSTTKDVSAKISAAVQGLGMSMVEDSMVKNMLNNYAAEHMEVGSYLTIRAAALELGDTETISVVDDILEDEYAMARWAEEHIPAIVSIHEEQLAH